MTICNKFGDVLDILEDIIIDGSCATGFAVSCNFDLFVLSDIDYTSSFSLSKYKIDSILLTYPYINDKCLLEICTCTNNIKTFSKILEVEDLEDVRKDKYISIYASDGLILFFDMFDIIRYVKLTEHNEISRCIKELAEIHKKYNNIYSEISKTIKNDKK